MQCFVYKSLKKTDMYLYLNEKEGFSSLPEALLNSMGTLEYVLEFELTSERKLGRTDPKELLANLKNRGFHLQMPATIASLQKTPNDRLNTHRSHY
ncbi:MAG: YcgL domain-containing protein [Gammaproteobacteria bacterium]|nr:YcgL domain-containing protein [Gammaproteobacteria bacterium]